MGRKSTKKIGHRVFGELLNTENKHVSSSIEEISQSQKAKVEKYLEERGTPAGEWLEFVGRFFKESRIYYRTNAMLNVIQNSDEFHLEFPKFENLTRTGKRLAVFKLIGKRLGLDEDTPLRWSDGRVDIPIHQVCRYWDDVGTLDDDSLIHTNNIEISRFAISRTLSLIMIYPWESLPNDIGKFDKKIRDEARRIIGSLPCNCTFRDLMTS